MNTSTRTRTLVAILLTTLITSACAAPTPSAKPGTGASAQPPSQSAPSKPAPTPDRAAFGSLDSVTVAYNRITASGWAADPDAPTEAVSIQVFDGSALLGNVLANQSRPDVASAHRGYGPAHGFKHTSTLGWGEHLICVKAANIGSGSAPAAPQIGCKLVNLIKPVSLGYTELPDRATAPAMTVKVHTNAAALLGDVQNVAAELSQRTGSTFTVSSTLTTSTEPRQGELVVSSGLMCNSPREAGCALVTAADGVITRAKVTIAPNSFGQDYQLATVRHEFGHAAGLAHFDDQFEGSYQVMRSSLRWDVNEFRSGDAAGLAALGARGRSLAALNRTASGHETSQIFE